MFLVRQRGGDGEVFELVEGVGVGEGVAHLVDVRDLHEEVDGRGHFRGYVDREPAAFETPVAPY